MIDHWTPERTSYIARCMFVLALVSIALNQAKGEAVFSTAQLCTGITSVHNIQDVIAAEALGQSVCIIFTGDEGGEYAALVMQHANLCCRSVPTNAQCNAGCGS